MARRSNQLPEVSPSRPSSGNCTIGTTTTCISSVTEWMNLQLLMLAPSPPPHPLHPHPLSPMQWNYKGIHLAKRQHLAHLILHSLLVCLEFWCTFCEPSAYILSRKYNYYPHQMGKRPKATYQSLATCSDFDHRKHNFGLLHVHS